MIKKCKRCGYKWLTRKLKDEPKECPNCKSRNWDKKKVVPMSKQI